MRFRGNLVRVVWTDAHHIGQSWLSDEEAIAECKSASLTCETVGRLIVSTEDRIAVAQSVSDGCVDNLMIIPRHAVISVQNILQKE